MVIFPITHISLQYYVLLYTCNEIHLIQPIFLLENTNLVSPYLRDIFPYHHPPYFTHLIT